HADAKRHDEPVAILREIVMDTMKDEVRPPLPGPGPHEVEDVAVQDILGKRPEQCARDQKPRPAHGPHTTGEPVVREVAENRDPKDERRRGMDAREPLDERGLEHLTGLRSRCSLLGSHWRPSPTRSLGPKPVHAR